MEFNKIIAVTGKPGLFEIVSQTKTGIIVESLLDKKRTPILSTHNVSLLENIAIFTYDEEVPLLTIFQSIYEKAEGKETISHKESGATLTSFFSEILPEYDQERVYISNIKKIIQWYNALIAVDFDFSAATLTSEETQEA